jgi:hypothetical protein
VFVAWQSIIGADLFWVVAMGRHIWEHGVIPQGLPFAAADSSSWHNVPVLAELLLAATAAPGDRWLVALQLGLVFTALGVLATCALREGGSDRRVAAATVLVALGALQALVILRLQILSLVPFAVLLVLLTTEHRRPSRRIWMLPVLVAVWSNLHGAVLLGVCVAGAYLVFARLRTRPVESLLLGAGTLMAVFLTPAGVNTGHYYAGVFGNVAARQGTDLWARPTLHNPFDVALTLAVVGLLILALRRRLAGWEYVAAAGLVLATLGAARNGTWLALVLFVPAARGPGEAAIAARPPRGYRSAVAAVLVVAACAAVTLARPHSLESIPTPVADAVQEVVGDEVLLAPEPAVEQLAADGVKVWLADPIDAFSPTDQSAYLDFLEGEPGGSVALDRVHFVLVEEGSDPAALVIAEGGWTRVLDASGWQVYRR